MIITSDKVGMSSSRDFSQALTQTYKTTTQFSGSFLANVSKWSMQDTESSKDQYDSYTSSGSRKQNQADATDSFDYLQGSFIYANLTASNFQTNAVSYPTAAVSDTTSVQSGSISNTFADFKKDAFYSLLDLIRNFRLRSLFEVEGSSDALIMSTNPSTVTWTVSTGFSSIYTEKEATTFSTTGTVTTADGRNIDFHMNLEMSREYMEQNQLMYMNNYSSVLTDPLVINLNDGPATISDQTFLFDIDGDGKNEAHASLGAGSGFLALDKNNDGVINDGSELFGTKSGDGFKDLSAYDSDGNGWIDEADEIYQDLKVWTKDENGKGTLLSLKEADVGAIYLGSSKTDFSMTDDTNNTRAQIRQTGIYLHEDGIAGSVQQVDL